MTSNTIMHTSFEVQEDKEDEKQDIHKRWGIMIGQTIQPGSINNGRYDYCNDAFIHYRCSKRYLEMS